MKRCVVKETLWKMILLYIDKPRAIRPDVMLGPAMLPVWDEFQDLGDTIPHFYFERVWYETYR